MAFPTKKLVAKRSLHRRQTTITNKILMDNHTNKLHPPSPVWVNGPIIVGAGPSGLAAASSLRLHSIRSLIIEKSDTIAPLWCHRTYKRLSLHLPKQFCQLPHFPFPTHFPTYPSRDDFLSYLLCYAHLFSLHPLFHHTVTDAHFDPALSAWRVTTLHSGVETEFVSRWLVVAAGENADPVVPELRGLETFTQGDKKKVVHSADYETGKDYSGKKVLVVGCGNSGMEVCLDLCEHGAIPFISVRNGVHVLPREMFGMSTFGLAMKLLKWFPLRWVDRFLLMVAKRMLGDTEQYELRRPKIGPIELKNATGKTPVLDIGTLAYIKNARIKILPEVECLTGRGAKFVDGREMGFDSVIFATGYKSNVPTWLKGSEFSPGWKGENGLYWVGFSGKGLLGTSDDAVNVARDIANKWRNQSENKYTQSLPT